MIGQGADIKVNAPMDLLLEIGLSLEQPKGDGQDIKWVLLEQGDERLDKQIGSHQCPVEVDNQRMRFRHLSHRSCPGEQIFFD